LALGDMPAAARVHRTSFDERLPWLAGLHAADEDRGFWSDHLWPDCTIIGAERDGDLVGVIAFREGRVEQLYVMPAAQGQGIGSALLEIAKAAYPQLCLWTFQRNVVARRFFEGHGFSIVNETDGAGNEEREPDMLYRWMREMPNTPLAK
jgi:GNAT superfamily N-acetyltransferase